MLTEFCAAAFINPTPKTGALSGAALVVNSPVQPYSTVGSRAVTYTARDAASASLKRAAHAQYGALQSSQWLLQARKAERIDAHRLVMMLLCSPDTAGYSTPAPRAVRTFLADHRVSFRE
jgi:hypothetical protein